MRYLMYKYTGINYGVTELDFSAFEITSFSSFSGGGSILEEYLKGWEMNLFANILQEKRHIIHILDSM